MPSPLTDNVAGHRLKYENLKAHYSPEDAIRNFVGGSDPLWTGYAEIECIRRIKPKLDGLSIVDIGCGIGRFAMHAVQEPISAYLGTDIVTEIMAEAERTSAGDQRFRFEIAKDCKIPLDDCQADVVIAFSVITHLLDEEVYEYFLEAKRVLKPGGAAFFSFMDLMNERHRNSFFAHAPNHRLGHGDLLKFTTKEVLGVFSEGAGFDRVEFWNGLKPIATSGIASKLVPKHEIPPTFSTGQSVCVMHA